MSVQWLVGCVIACVVSLTAAAQSVDLAKEYGARQLVVVTTADFATKQGRLTYYELDPNSNRWQQKLSTFAITVGRRGLAWGAGLHRNTKTDGPRKREGDGKSPAGIFRIGMAFGSHHAQEIGPLRIPYIRADGNTFCVDDTASTHYNQIVSTDTLRANWISAERMLIPAYEYGLVVEYNYAPAQPGDGSCIFIHLWRDNQTGTSGCTAMSESNLLQLIRRLDAQKRPLLVQMPEREYAKYKETYGLP